MKKKLIWGVAGIFIFLQIFSAFQNANHPSFEYASGFLLSKVILILLAIVIAFVLSKKVNS